MPNLVKPPNMINMNFKFSSRNFNFVHHITEVNGLSLLYMAHIPYALISYFLGPIRHLGTNMPPRFSRDSKAIWGMPDHIITHWSFPYPDGSYLPDLHRSRFSSTGTAWDTIFSTRMRTGKALNGKFTICLIIWPWTPSLPPSRFIRSLNKSFVIYAFHFSRNHRLPVNSALRHDPYPYRYGLPSS